MNLLLIVAALFAVVTGLLYVLSYGMVLLFEHLQRNYRRRRALIPLTRRLHELLEEAGHPPVTPSGAGRHRLAPAENRRKPVRAARAVRTRHDTGHPPPAQQCTHATCDAAYGTNVTRIV